MYVTAIAARIVGRPARHDRDSMISHERKARVETRLLAAMAALGLLSVAASMWSLGGARLGEPAVGVEREVSEPGEAALALVGEARSVAPTRSPTFDLHADDEAAAIAEPTRALDGDVASWTEKDHYDRFVELAAREPATLEAQAAELLRGDSADCAKVALLRALYASGSARAAEFFALAVTELPDRSDARGESVPRTAVHWLVKRAPREEAARAILAVVASCAPGKVPDLDRDAANKIPSIPEESVQ